MEKSRCISQELLKLIACVTMLTDHIGAVFFPDTLWLRIIGRIAFPIYCFLLAEGMRHTRNPVKYLLRLMLGILLAELPFDYLFFGRFTWEHQSVMVTLTWGAFMLLCMQKLPNRLLKILLAVAFALIAEASMCDYGGYGILLIAIFGLRTKWQYQLPLVLALGLVKDAQYVVDALQYFPNRPTADAISYILRVSPPIQSLSFLAMAPISLYSGRKQTRSKTLQTTFYLFYPVHLTLLWIIANFLL